MKFPVVLHDKIWMTFKYEWLWQAGFGLGCGLGTLYTIKCGGEGALASGFGSAAMFSALILTSAFIDRSLIAILCRFVSGTDGNVATMYLQG